VVTAAWQWWRAVIHTTMYAVDFCKPRLCHTFILGFAHTQGGGGGGPRSVSSRAECRRSVQLQRAPIVQAVFCVTHRAAAIFNL
jgi:hypothetical protein